MSVSPKGSSGLGFSSPLSLQEENPFSPWFLQMSKHGLAWLREEGLALLAVSDQQEREARGSQRKGRWCLDKSMNLSM